MEVSPVPHFLIFDSFALLQSTFLLHPVLSSLGILVLFGSILGVLRLKFERIDSDVIIFAVVICVIVLLLGTSLLTFLHVRDFHFA